MPEVRFIELRILAAESRSSTGRQCAAIVSRDNDCEVRFFDDASEVRQLHDKLHDGPDLDTACLAETLKGIAELTLCDLHNKEEEIAAAVEQWESEISPHFRASSTEPPQTPQPKKTHDIEQLQFSPYKSPNSKAKPPKTCTPKEIDMRVRTVLAGDIENQGEPNSSLYVFSFKGAEGLYKVGQTKRTKRISEHAKCYPGLKVHRYIACSNAKLFERVVHAQLVNHRHSHPCNSCVNPKGNPVMHGEWFKAPEEDILKMVDIWSFYADMLYRYGFTVDVDHQRFCLPDRSSNPDRWTNWAWREILRWKVESSLPEFGPVETAVTKELGQTEDVNGSDSETASAASSPASLVDTPATTPSTTPLTTPGSYVNDEEDYTQSPTPAQRYTKVKPAEIVDEDEGGEEHECDAVSDKQTARALFRSPEKDQPELSHVQLYSNDSQSLPSAEEGSSAPSDAGSVPATSSRESSLRALIDDQVRLALKAASRDKSEGTIYLTRRHPEMESYKIYNRKKRAHREGTCYSNLDIFCDVQCINKERVQKLVLAEFAGQIDERTCGDGYCRTSHKNWISAPGETIEASIRAWSELVRVGYDASDIPADGFSQDEDRWTKWAVQTAAKDKKEATKDEDIEETATTGTRKGEPGDGFRALLSWHQEFYTDTPFSKQKTNVELKINAVLCLD
ncbi:hypothetical protein BJX62DRAFT_228119 [Aspergillus germanicus]